MANKKIKAIIISIVSIIIVAAITVGAVFYYKSLTKPPISTDAIPDTQTSSAPLPDPVTITIGSTGDVLLHSPILTAHKKSDGSYDFSDIFAHAKTEFEKYDYMVANLEVTCAGSGRSYSGYPCFNSPDNIVTSLKNSGVDMLLTANNHCFDTSTSGFWRTQETIKAAGLEHIGTFTEGVKPYLIKNINGIKIGMINYTYETTASNGRKALNGITVSLEAENYVNSFSYNNLESFYSELQTNITSMYADGAEAIMVYLHWGNEYQLSPSAQQKSIAARLCDMGVDVIVGGHPHVVQPIEILTSDISGKQTVCLYSMGNAVSNQLKANMNLKTGHTEDGMIFETSFTKNSDGSVHLSGINATPTWSNRFETSLGRRYMIIPLINGEDFKSKYSHLGRANEMQSSFDRTMELINSGLEDFKTQYRQNDLRPVS